VERTVVGDHLTGQKRDADDDDEKGVQRRAGDEQTGPAGGQRVQIRDIRGQVDDDDEENIVQRRTGDE